MRRHGLRDDRREWIKDFLPGGKVMWEARLRITVCSWQPGCVATTRSFDDVTFPPLSETGKTCSAVSAVVTVV